jgi:hypothetical protein
MTHPMTGHPAWVFLQAEAVLPSWSGLQEQQPPPLQQQRQQQRQRVQIAVHQSLGGGAGEPTLRRSANEMRARQRRAAMMAFRLQ